MAGPRPAPSLARLLFGALQPIVRPTLPEIPIGAAPAAPAPEEIWESDGRDRWVRNVPAPSLIPVRPADDSVRSAVLVLPGGAFRALSIDNEGLALAHDLAAAGLAAFVLKYRTVQTPDAVDGFYDTLDALFAEGLARAPTAQDLAPTAEALEDALTAIRFIRSHAAELGVDPARIAIIGFSAGAIMAVHAALSDRPSRPDLVASIYPAMLALPVPDDAPPLFAVVAADDPLFGGQGFGLVEAWRASGARAELHALEAGGHGFGMWARNAPTGLWPAAFKAWLDLHGWMQAKGEEHAA